MIHLFFLTWLKQIPWSFAISGRSIWRNTTKLTFPNKVPRSKISKQIQKPFPLSILLPSLESCYSTVCLKNKHWVSGRKGKASMPIQPGNKTPRFQSILPLAVSVVSKQSNPQLMRIGPQVFSFQEVSVRWINKRKARFLCICNHMRPSTIKD